LAIRIFPHQISSFNWKKKQNLISQMLETFCRISDSPQRLWNSINHEEILLGSNNKFHLKPTFHLSKFKENNRTYSWRLRFWNSRYLHTICLKWGPIILQSIICRAYALQMKRFAKLWNRQGFS
jgi:hypothetical protein